MSQFLKNTLYYSPCFFPKNGSETTPNFCYLFYSYIDDVLNSVDKQVLIINANQLLGWLKVSVALIRTHFNFLFSAMENLSLSSHLRQSHHLLGKV